MKVEEPRPDYSRNNINMPIIDHVGLSLEFGNISKRFVWSIGGQKYLKNSNRILETGVANIEDQCLQKVI